MYTFAPSICTWATGGSGQAVAVHMHLQTYMCVYIHTYYTHTNTRAHSRPCQLIRLRLVRICVFFFLASSFLPFLFPTNTRTGRTPFLCSFPLSVPGRIPSQLARAERGIPFSSFFLSFPPLLPWRRRLLASESSQGLSFRLDERKAGEGGKEERGASGGVAWVYMSLRPRAKLARL